MITICIASYKYGHLLAQAIESVLCQTKPAKRVLVVDDGVGDCDIAIQYPVEYIKRTKNMGIVDNFNDMLSRVKTDRVLFLGADNWLHPQTLELLDASGADIVSYDCYMVGTEVDMGVMAQYEQDGYPVWKTKGTPHGSSLYNVKKAKQVGGYERGSGEKSEEDSQMFNKMIKEGATVDYIERPLLYYRQHKGNFQ